MEIRSRSCFVCLMLAVSACFMATTALAQYQGIWKDTADPPSHNFYIQHYSTGSTIVIHTSDAITFHAFLANISGNRFEADSLDADRNMHLVITFTTGSLGTATLTDNSTGASAYANVEKKFAAVRTMHSGVWKDAASVFNMYVQDYEAGSTVIVYTFDAVHFEAFLGKVDQFLFAAQNMADQSLEMDMMFSAFDEGTVTVEPEATTGYRPWAAPFTYDLTKVFQPAELDIDILCTPASGPSPLEVEFAGASTITFISWSWDFGDGGTSMQQYPQHTYSSPGTYTAVLTMSNPLLSMTCIASEPVIVQQPGANPVIGGTVTLSTGGGGLAGVTLTAGNGGGSTTTDSGGAYSITVTGGWSGTLTPSLSGYTFNPASQSFASVTSNKTQNFVATPDTGQTITISGTITASGAGLSGVAVVLSTGQSTTTSASGAYSFTLAEGWSGVVTPSLTGYTFTPGSQAFTNVTSNRTQNFTASAQAVTISGTVSLSGGGGIGMVQIEFQNLGLIFTDSWGNYSYDVPYNWAGTVTPYKENYSFTPSQAYPNGVTVDLTGVDFVGSLIQQYMPVSGNVTDSGSGLGIQWVQISLQGWGTTSTDAQGTWSTQVPYGWGGSISASLTGYTFWPVELILSSVTSPATGINFTGTAVQTDVTLSGTITDGSQGVSGVTLSYTGDSATGTTTTDATGHYSFTVPSGWSGYASPSKTGWTFAPPSIGYSNQTTDSVQSYTGFPPEPTISGTVTADPIYGSGPLSGVEVIFTTSGGGVWAVYTDSSGYYSSTVPYNWSGGWVASLTNWTFSPTFYNAAWVIEDLDNADFVGK